MVDFLSFDVGFVTFSAGAGAVIAQLLMNAAIFNAESRAHAEERLRVFLETWCDKQPKLVTWAKETSPKASPSSICPRHTAGN